MQRTILTRAAVAVAAAGALAVAAAVALPASAEQQAPSAPAAAPAGPAEQAAENADAAVAAPAARTALRRAADDRLTRTGVLEGTRGLRFVTYARTYDGLPVVGGDVVVATDAEGDVQRTAVAQSQPITVDTTPSLAPERAVATAREQLESVEGAAEPTLVVYAQTGAPKLAWETVVTGVGDEGVESDLQVWVDATSGAVLGTNDRVRHDAEVGEGTGHHYGTVPLTTWRSGSQYSMTENPRHANGLACRPMVSGTAAGPVYAGGDNVWGNGGATDLETACVDAMYAAQRQNAMLKDWFKRNGVRGDGTTPPIWVGLNDVNAYWNGDHVELGHNQARSLQNTAIDIVAHEMGHAIFQFTPGGANGTKENGGINEATGDIFGALTEAYANHPKDTPDYAVGDKVNLLGNGPFRHMYDPSLRGHPACYPDAMAAIAESEKKPDDDKDISVHALAGPLNYWFYLLAEGSAPVNGKALPTCKGAAPFTGDGIGIRLAGEIYYNALQSKTSSWRHPNIRVATLGVARTLFKNTCTEFNAVKAAWTAIGVPAQPAEPTCTTNGNNQFSVTVSPGAGSVAPGGTVATTVTTRTTSGAAQSVALSVEGLPEGATASFSPPTVTSGASSTLTIVTAPGTRPGNHRLRVVGAGVQKVEAAYDLTVDATCSAAVDDDLPIPDASPAVTSAVTVQGCGRAASATATVTVSVVHTFRGDVVLELFAPDGVRYRLKANDPEDDGADIAATFTVNLSRHPADGEWKLSVRDVYSADTGHLNAWALHL